MSSKEGSSVKDKVKRIFSKKRESSSGSHQLAELDLAATAVLQPDCPVSVSEAA